MKRRAVIALLGGAVAASVLAPLASPAQQRTMPVIGWLGSTAPQTQHTVPFLQGLKSEGFTEGQNVAVQYRWAHGHYDRLPAFAAEFVRQRVDVIAAITTVSALAAKPATDTVPTVFVTGSDPIRQGLVASMNRPGGNRTGINLITHTLNAKRLEMIRELIPAATSIGVLLNPSNPSAETNKTDVLTAARMLGLQVRTFNITSESDLNVAFATLAQDRPGALVVGADSLLHSLSDMILQFAARHAMPAVYEWREHVEAGGLISYGTKLAGAFRQVGVYAGRILKGAKPSDLPVLEPAIFELAINLKTARALGIAVPPTLLARADMVIE